MSSLRDSPLSAKSTGLTADNPTANYYQFKNHFQEWNNKCKSKRWPVRGRRFGGTADLRRSIYTLAQCCRDQQPKFKSKGQETRQNAARDEASRMQAALHKRVRAILRRRQTEMEAGKPDSRSGKTREQGPAPPVKEGIDDVLASSLRVLSIDDRNAPNRSGSPESRTLSDNTSATTTLRYIAPYTAQPAFLSPESGSPRLGKAIIKHFVGVFTDTVERFQKKAPKELFHLRHAPPIHENEYVATDQSEKGTSVSGGDFAISNVYHLQLLERPIVYRYSANSDDFPVTIRKLFLQTVNLSVCHGYLPCELKDNSALQAKSRMPLLDHMFATTPSTRSQEELNEELKAMITIHDAARKFNTTGQDEATWNAQVHWPILQQALKPHPIAAPVVATNLALQSTRKLRTRRDEPTTSLTVDYLLVVDDSRSEFIDLVDGALFARGLTSISPTVKDQLMHTPIGAIIGTTMAAGNDEEAKAKVAYWAAAQFSVLRTLLGNETHAVPMPIPLIIIEGAVSSLYFAVDNDDHIDVLSGDEAFGNTATIEGAYRTLAGLRLVAEWVELVWKPWFVDACRAAVY